MKQFKDYNQQTNINMEFTFIFLAIVSILSLVSVFISVTPTTTITDEHQGEDFLPPSEIKDQVERKKN